MSDKEVEMWPFMGTQQCQSSSSSLIIAPIPQSSEYEADPSNDAVNMNDDDDIPYIKPKSIWSSKHKSKPTTPKKLLCHEAAFQNEQLIIVTTKLKQSIEMCGGLCIMKQHSTICFFIQETVHFEVINLLKNNSWPEFQHCKTFQHDILMAVAGCNRGLEGFDDVHQQIKQNQDFCDSIGNVVLDCLSMTQSLAKTQASAQIAAYKLGVGKKCTQCIDVLFEDDGVYIFLGEWTAVSVADFTNL
ncbi:hypothetical protein BDQ17DRAFT_1437185 [Cyathus striatus]|nr:hypothetical protein BDQ17DRAFT_1437185 [Cyathus striatus]